MTGVSDLFQNRPPLTGKKRLSWIRSTGGRRTSVSVLDARRWTLQRGQNLKERYTSECANDGDETQAGKRCAVGGVFCLRLGTVDKVDM